MTANGKEIADLFDEHFDAVYSYVAFRTAPDLNLAADISQDVFEAAMRGLAELRSRESARSWLLGIARNKVADHFRRCQRHGKAEPLTEVLADRLSDPKGPSAERSRRERALRVSQVMRQLSDHQTDLLEDKYLRSLSVREIAREQDTTEKAIESALNRAREAFRRVYEHVRQSEESPR